MKNVNATQIPKSSDTCTQGWYGGVCVGFTQSHGRTVLKHRTQMGPLATQRPLYPEGGICHTYILHPPGGVVGGDTLDIRCSVHKNAHVVLTTPGATKFYMSDGRVATQKQNLHIEHGADLEYIPQESIFFKGCNARIHTDIHCHTGGRFMVWEWNCFGRPANQEIYTDGTVQGHTRIFINGTQVLHERLNYDGTDTLFRTVGLHNYPMQASFYISTDNTTPNLIKTLRTVIKNSALSATNGICGITQMDNIIVVRMLSVWAETIRHIFTTIWQAVRYARYNMHPTIPRIWNT